MNFLLNIILLISTLQLTLEQKVAQLFIVRPEALENLDPAAYPVAGYCLFAQNFNDAEQLDSLVNALRASNPTALMCIDEEGGRVARIGNTPAFDVPHFSPMKTVARGGAEAVHKAGKAIGQYLHNYGIDVDFAPVADVDTNPDNPVIGSRAFSENPEVAARMALEFALGLNDAGVISCLKHFPGHGDTSTDSHLGMARSDKSWEEMLQCEIIPFRKGIEAGVPMVMMGHISTPNVTGDDVPASLNPYIVEGKLRGELRFRGVVITDAMEMGAVADRYDDGEAALMALMAGVDIILMPKDFMAAYKKILSAVKDGKLSESRIDESIERINVLRSLYR